MKKLFIFCYTLLIFQFVNAQSWIWAKQFEISSAIGNAVSTDLSGNVYMACSGWTGARGNTYLRKYTPAGDVIWTKTYGNNSN